MAKVYVFNRGGRPTFYMKAKIGGEWVVRSTGTKKKREADRVAYQWERDIAEGQYVDAGKTWKTAVELYESTHIEGLRPGSQLDALGTLDQFTKFADPSKVTDVSADTLSAFVAHLRRRKPKPAAVSTIGKHLRNVRAFLRWAKEHQYIATVPAIPKLKSVHRDLMKGRPLTVEEFERMLSDQALGKVLFKHSGRGVKKDPDTKRFTSWRHLLRGLYLGGLRIGEAMNLSWDDPTKLMVDTSIPGNVFLRIAHGGQKANRDELLPIAPEFEAFLLATPEGRRTGFVFNPQGQRGNGRISQKQAERIIARIGNAANVVTDSTEERTATAHDLRRSFGDRWAARVMPATLQVLMRHKSINTTLKYYAKRQAQTVAAELKRAMQGFGNQVGNQSEFEAAKK